MHLKSAFIFREMMASYLKEHNYLGILVPNNALKFVSAYGLHQTPLRVAA